MCSDVTEITLYICIANFLVMSFFPASATCITFFFPSSWARIPIYLVSVTVRRHVSVLLLLKWLWFWVGCNSVMSSYLFLVLLLLCNFLFLFVSTHTVDCIECLVVPAFAPYVVRVARARISQVTVVSVASGYSLVCFLPLLFLDCFPC